MLPTARLIKVVSRKTLRSCSVQTVGVYWPWATDVKLDTNTQTKHVHNFFICTSELSLFDDQSEVKLAYDHHEHSGYNESFSYRWHHMLIKSFYGSTPYYSALWWHRQWLSLFRLFLLVQSRWRPNFHSLLFLTHLFYAKESTNVIFSSKPREVHEL
jgi:hypothetical protein